MTQWRPDPTFYPSPRQAMEAPPEELAYVAMLDPKGERPDAMGVVDVAPGRSSFGQLVGQVDMSSPGDELHHFGWNACSACLAPYAPHAHVERRYLIVPGIASSRIHILDTKPDPRKPKIVKRIEAETIAKRVGYSAPHTTHCGPDGIYVNALGAPDGGGPGGIFVLDHETLDIAGPWEESRGPQYLAYDFYWHLGYDTMITSEWGTPNMVQNGVNPELLLAGKYGHALHVWDLRRRRHQQTLDLGPEHQMVLELRPAHDPTRPYGFAGVVISLADLSASILTLSRYPSCRTISASDMIPTSLPFSVTGIEWNPPSRILVRAVASVSAGETVTGLAAIRSPTTPLYRCSARMVSTGQGDSRTTRSATLPKNRCGSPVRP